MQTDSLKEQAEARLVQLRQQRQVQQQGMRQRVIHSDKLPARPRVAVARERTPSPSHRQGGVAALIPWFYRGWLLCATVALTLLLLRLQSILDHVPAHASILRAGVQWAELTWLAPVPLAIFLWLGWFIFAEAVRSHPEPLRVPFVASPRGFFAFGGTKPVRLVFRFVTRGDNVAVLRDSVIAVHRAFARYPQQAGPYQIEIISECPVDLNMGIDSRTYIYVVPRNYVTQNHSRFKARALTFLQESTQCQPEDWYIYLDEESLIDEQMLAGLYHFVWRSLEFESRKQEHGEHGDGKRGHAAGLIGQGAILYQGGNWFFRGADALRTADDLGRFRLQYALGVPMFGIHGSFIVVRGTDDVHLSFDVGASNSITEDAAWALRAWAQGYRFAWVDGYLHEQPPQRARDFVRQRSRWLSGIRAVLRDEQTPLAYRLCLGIFTTLWQLAFLPLLVAIIALFVHASPFQWMRIPADFAWATFTLAYLQGIDIQSKHLHPFLKKKRVQWKRIVSWLLVLCSIWYALLEALGVLYSLRPKQGFFVIQKPSLAEEDSAPMRPATSLPVPQTGFREGRPYSVQEKVNETVTQAPGYLPMPGLLPLSGMPFRQEMSPSIFRSNTPGQGIALGREHTPFPGQEIGHPPFPGQEIEPGRGHPPTPGRGQAVAPTDGFAVQEAYFVHSRGDGLSSPYSGGGGRHP